jgi:hypothetical protein
MWGAPVANGAIPCGIAVGGDSAAVRVVHGRSGAEQLRGNVAKARLMTADERLERRVSLFARHRIKTEVPNTGPLISLPHV